MADKRDLDRSFIDAVLDLIAAILTIFFLVAAVRYLVGLDRKSKLVALFAAIFCSLLGYFLLLTTD